MVDEDTVYYIDGVRVDEETFANETEGKEFEEVRVRIRK